MSQIRTTLGVRPESFLARTVGFEDRPSEFVVWVEWRTLTDARADDGTIHPAGEIVRRDAHVILKEPSVVATLVAGNLAHAVDPNAVGG